MKLFIYILFEIIHGIVAGAIGYYLGIFGLLLIVGHWYLFNWNCCFVYINRWFHLKLVNDTFYRDIKPFNTTLFYRIFFG